ncbi:class I SAM-dependent RNA methyltransferase [Desulfonauticus submarinus]
MDFLEVKIEKLIWRGRGLGRKANGQVVIVDPLVLPSETVRVKVYKAKKDYLLAIPVEILNSSKKRRIHPCVYASECGGCKFGSISVQLGTKLKLAILKDAFKRFDFLNYKDVPISTLPSPKGWRYRYRGQVFIHRHLPGFKKLGSHEFVPIKDCLLFTANLGKNLVKLARKKSDGRYSVISNGEDLAIEGDNKELKFFLPKIPLVFLFSAEHFFQANWKLNQTLIDLVCSILAQEEKIADLYAGAGNFSLPLAFYGKKVLALELNKNGVLLGEKTAKINNLGVNFKQVDLNRNFSCVEQFDPEAIVVDPPRMGAPALKKCVSHLKNLRKIVWISCDVVNSLRDLKPFIDVGFRLTKLYFLDMFPQTWHMEVLFVLGK